jgi:hypothetical protein
MVDRDADRAEIQRRLARRASQDANSEWLNAHLAAIEPEPTVQADPRVVRQMQVPGHYEDPRKLAWAVYSAKRAEDPADEYAAEREKFVKKDVWGQSGPDTRNLRSHRSSWR